MSGAESGAAAPDSLEGDVNKKKRKKHSKTRQVKRGDDAELQRRREAKWLDMLDHWDEFMLRNYKKVKSILNYCIRTNVKIRFDNQVRERCRKGLPSSVRARAWLHLCGAKYQLMNPENRTTFKRLYVSLFSSLSISLSRFICRSFFFFLSTPIVSIFARYLFKRGLLECWGWGKCK